MVPVPELGVVPGSTAALSKMQLNWQPLLDQFPQWEALAATLNPEKFARHGDYSRWQQALDALPELVVERVSLGDRVTIAGRADEAERQVLEASLRQLHPWRKGPFELFGIHIDTEWRSDWKWQRLAPHLAPLTGCRVLDVGCGNGYFGWRALAAGASTVVGVDPTLLFFMQHLAISRYLPHLGNWLLPIKFEELPIAQFDLVLSMGVIYHRRDPAAHVAELMRCCRPGGQLVVESLVVEGHENLIPQDRYARMGNVHLLPTSDQLAQWLTQAGCQNTAIVDITPTSLAEQRSTDWMQFESLAAALNPDDPSLTVEGLPAPLRTIVIGQRPA